MYPLSFHNNRTEIKQNTVEHKYIYITCRALAVLPDEVKNMGIP